MKMGCIFSETACIFISSVSCISIIVYVFEIHFDNDEPTNR